VVVGGPVQEFLRLAAPGFGHRHPAFGEVPAISSILSRIAAQSRTIARTSPSTSWILASIAGIASGLWRSISRCMSDSPSPSPTLSSLPARSRTNATTGWPSTCTPIPRSDRAMVTESTRNGMSPFTTCSTVCGDSQSCPGPVLNIRTLAVSALRLRAKSRKSAASAAQPSGGWSAYSASIMRFVEGAREGDRLLVPRLGQPLAQRVEDRFKGNAVGARDGRHCTGHVALGKGRGARGPQVRDPARPRGKWRRPCPGMPGPAPDSLARPSPAAPLPGTAREAAATGGAATSTLTGTGPWMDLIAGRSRGGR
jgi:hypothetical protein